MQIARDFCDHSNSVCDGCKLPEFVEEVWAVNKVAEVE
jgi:hypothetical protein